MTQPARLDADAVDAALASANSPWTRSDERLVLERSFPSFRESIAFVIQVAFLAERVDHHPDVVVHYNEVRLELWTHVAGGLTERDLELAAKIAAIGT